MTMQCTAYYIINVLSLQFSKAVSFFHLERCRLPSQLFLHLPPIPHVFLLVVDLDSWQVHLSSVTALQAARLSGVSAAPGHTQSLHGDRSDNIGSHYTSLFQILVELIESDKTVP